MTRPNRDDRDRVSHRLKLRDLQILFAVLQQGSMAKGATQLGISQPSVSEALANLEAILGVRLLDRSPRGVEPTIYATALLRRAHVIFDELQLAVRDIQFLSDRTAGEIRIGCPESLAAGFVPAVVERLSQRFPGVTVHVLSAQTGEQEFRELRDREVDLLLGRLFRPLTADDIVVDPLCQDALFVVAGANSPWTRRRKIALAELMDEPWILFPPHSVSGSYIEAGMRALGQRLPERAISSYSMQLRFHLLSGGRFLTVLHGSVLRFNAERWSLRALPSDLRLPARPIGIFTLKGRTLSPVVQLFIDQAHEIARTLSLRPNDPAGTRVQQAHARRTGITLAEGSA